jgi:hypothetical protein
VWICRVAFDVSLVENAVYYVGLLRDCSNLGGFGIAVFLLGYSGGKIWQ